jgi:hypothetical protein
MDAMARCAATHHRVVAFVFIVCAMVGGAVGGSIGDTCGEFSINEALKSGLWKPKSRSMSQRSTFPPECRFLSHRFACPNAFTSADEYVFDFTLKSKKSKCEINTPEQTFAVISAKARSVLLCGDSQMTQLYQSTLCLLREHLVAVDFTKLETDETHTINRAKDPDSEFPHCHGTDVERRRVFDRPIIEHLSSSCDYAPPRPQASSQLSSTPVMSCATLEDRYVWICFVQSECLGSLLVFRHICSSDALVLFPQVCVAAALQSMNQ